MFSKSKEEEEVPKQFISEGGTLGQQDAK